MGKINILGTEYDICIDNTLVKSGLDGQCKEYDKLIQVRSAKNMLCEEEADEVKRRRFNEVLRHEIVHAFFIEAGLNEYYSDEQLVDWIAIQFPKILKAFQEAECI